MTVSLDKAKNFFQNRTVRTVLACLTALVLLLLVYFVFFRGSKETGYMTETEERLVRIVEQLDEVKSCTAMVTEENGSAVRAVIVFVGEDGFLLRLRITELAAGALNLPKNGITVVPAKS